MHNKIYLEYALSEILQDNFSSKISETILQLQEKISHFEIICSEIRISHLVLLIWCFEWTIWNIVTHQYFFCNLSTKPFVLITFW